MGRADRPVVLMAFANPAGDLFGLQKELGAVEDSFRKIDDLVELKVLERVSLDRIGKAFQFYRDRIVLFHFAGHAESFELMFETSDGKSHSIGARNFAQFLATQKRLGVVFLNGCSTDKQATDLLAAGVKCVISTSDKIEDATAIDFATKFYEALTTRAAIQDAFTEASELTLSKRGGNTRGLTFGSESESTSDNGVALPWRIHLADERESGWNLVQIAERDKTSSARSPAQSRSHQQRMQLLQKVRNFWVSGMLSRSTDNGILSLSKESRPDVINDPWEAIVETQSSEPEVIEPGKRVLDVFQQVNNSLLILGQPGSGKTTSLLELANDLIEQAETDIEFGVPVVFHLSAYTNPKTAMLSWLEGELSDKYQIPRKIGSEWLREGYLILLLDGLDEIARESRAACVNAIDELLEEITVPGICVCSRVQEYEELGVKLKLGGAISLQPLTSEQILGYLESGGPKTATLKSLLEKQPSLQNLAQSPLMLNIMSEAYRDIPPEKIEGEQFNTPEGCRKHTFDTYIDRMFSSRGARDTTFSREQTTTWLSWLANKIHRESGSAIVMIENLQPNFLGRKSERAVWLVLVCLALTLITTFVASLFWWAAGQISPKTLLGWEQGYTTAAFLTLLCWYLAMGTIEKHLPNYNVDGNATLSQTIVQSLIKMVTWFVIWVGLAFVFGPPDGKTDDGNNLFHLLLFSGGLGSILWGFYGRSFHCFSQIRPVETVGFNRRAALRSMLFGGLAGMAIWLMACLLWSSDPDGPQLAFWFNDKTSSMQGYLIFLIGFVVQGIVIGCVLGGRVPKIVHKKSVPNQGMRLSLNNALRSGALTAVATGPATMFVFSIQNLGAKKFSLTYMDGMIFSVGTAFAWLFAAFLWSGGFAIIKHYSLRVILFAFGYIPANPARFLDYATRLDFMTRVGGGYIFNHRLLLEHFATMTPPKTTDDSSSTQEPS